MGDRYSVSLRMIGGTGNSENLGGLETNQCLDHHDLQEPELPKLWLLPKGGEDYSIVV